MEFKTSSLIIAVCLFAVIVPAMVLYYFRKARTAAVKFSSIGNLKKVKPSLLYKLRHIPLIFRILAITFLLLGFARPRIGDKQTEVFTEGVAIQMVVDRSSSMNEPMRYEGKELSRFEVVKEVFEDFVKGTNALTGRKNDMIGLASFAAFVEENCPLTLDHDNLMEFIRGIRAIRTPVYSRFGRVVAADPDDGTAIGDAIYYAVLRLINAENEINIGEKESRKYTIKSKIIIVLTDGQQNAGEYLPVEAAEFAKQNGIKIYTIAVVPEEGYQTLDTLLSRFQRPLDEELDISSIREAARITGGRFEKATSGESLENIYKKIDRLEKSRFESKFLGYNELFTKWWAVPAALLFLFFEIILANTWFRKIP